MERCRKTAATYDREGNARPVAKAPFGRLTRPHQGPRSGLTPEGRRLSRQHLANCPNTETVPHDLGDDLGQLGPDQKTHRVFLALWEGFSKAMSNHDREANARPVGAIAPADRNTGSSPGGFGPPA